MTPSSQIYPVARRVQQAFSKIAEVRPAYSSAEMSLDRASAKKAREAFRASAQREPGRPAEHPRAGAFLSERTVLQLEPIRDPNTGTEFSDAASVTVLCPSIFAHIRSLYGLDNQDLLEEFALAQSLGFLPSPGKSPTIFLYGGSGRFIVKQLKSKELRYILACAHAYAAHLSMYPSSLIIRLLGVYTVSLRGKDFHLCVMPNLFDTPLPISRRYDVKGSFVGRTTKRPKEGSTLKDNDLRHNVPMEAGRRWLLLAQLERDSEFFARWNFIDYSLLLGEAVWFDDARGVAGMAGERGGEQGRDQDRQQGHGSPSAQGITQNSAQSSSAASPPPCDISSLTPDTMDELAGPGSIFTREMGGFFCDSPLGCGGQAADSAALGEAEGSAAPASPELAFPSAHAPPAHTVLYLGVIDFLTDYNWFKSMETALKGIRHDKHGVSAVPAREYKERFMRAMREVFVVSTGWEVPAPAEAV